MSFIGRTLTLLTILILYLHLHLLSTCSLPYLYLHYLYMHWSQYIYYNVITVIKLQLASLQCSFFIKDKLHKHINYILATFYFSTTHLIMLYFFFLFNFRLSNENTHNYIPYFLLTPLNFNTYA